MSVSVALQDAILALLRNDPEITAIVGNRIYDGTPSNAVFPYIDFGPTEQVRVDADCIPGREESFQIDTWHQDNGKKWPCKVLVDAIVSRVNDADANLSSGSLVVMTVERTRIIEDPDGITVHGVVQITATIEEPR